MQAPLCPVSSRYSYHVVTSAAQMPNSCRGVYQRIGLLEVDHHEQPVDYVPTRIAEINGLRIVATWEGCNVGKTEACAAAKAKRDAAAMADECRQLRAVEAAADTGVAA